MTTYAGTPKTFAVGETLTAATMNAEVRDPLEALTGAWNSWTPTLAQGASTDIAKTVNYAEYIRIGKLVIGKVMLSATAAGTSGSDITITLPVTAGHISVHVPLGHAMYNDAGTVYHGAAVTSGVATSMAIRRGDVATAGSDLVGTDPAIAVASGDIISAEFTYEAA